MSVAHGHDQCLQELFEAQVGRTPEAVAVVFGDRKLTYLQLNQRANQLAHYLRKLGVMAEVPVGICVERSLEMIVGLLAILKAGGAYVPLDPKYPIERLQYMLEEIQAPVLLTQQALVHRLPEQPARIVCLDADKEIIAEESDENLPPATTPENLAYVIYTSGSTGRPKGVQICHRSVFRLLETTRPLFGFGEHDVWTAFHSYGFDFSVWEIWAALLQGGRLVIVPPDVVQSPISFTDLLRRERVTVLNQTPSAMRQLIDARRQTTGSDQKAAAALTSAIRPEALRDLTLRLIICGGEAFPPELVAPILEWNVPVWNFYGPTEATVWSTIKPISPMCSEHDAVPIGHPIGDRQICLLDHNLQPVPIGVPGELHIGGAGLARGYFNCPELTAQKFIPDSFTERAGARLYKTGDLARYLPDGTLDFLGRLDYQVKIRGFRVELAEIEATLTQHRAVRAAVVTVREDASGAKRLVAYIVPDPQQAYTISDFHTFLRERLPDYMVPSAFVALDAFPLNANGKVDRRALPAPDAVRPELEQTFAAPRNPVEEILAQIWSEVLQIERIGIHDNFFELGGHSLLATQVISRLRNAINLDVALRSLFENPTIAGLADRVDALSWAGERYQASINSSSEEREEIKF
jgi:amino acid adenylation domain-containing protein